MSFRVSYLYQFTAKVLVDMYFNISKRISTKKKSLYIYTDSRGFYVNKWYCKKNPLHSYIDMLSNDYRIDYSLCNYKHTTLIDFLCDYQDKIRNNKYDAIILHLGVVDFSPRTEQQAEEVLAAKKARLSKVYNSELLPEFSPHIYNESYEGKSTASIYTKEFLRDFIVNKINHLNSRVIWIGVNRVLTDWNGNYEKKRPSNINQIMEYQQIINNYFTGEIVSLDDLSDEEIRKYTVDNIHLSREGFKFISNLIESKLNSTRVIT